MADDVVIRTKAGVPVDADFENIVTRDGGFTRIYIVIDTDTGRPYTRLSDGTIQPVSLGVGSATGTNTGDVTLAGENYLSIAGQVITAADVNLTTHVTGTLPVGNGGTGLTSVGTANQLLGTNAAATGLEHKSVTVTAAGAVVTPENVTMLNFVTTGDILGVNKFGGGFANTGNFLTLAYTATHNDGCNGFGDRGSLTMTAGTTRAVKAYLGQAGGITINTGGAVTDIGTLALGEPNITLSGGSTATNAATLLIYDAPTEATNNYAIFVKSGATRLDGTLTSSGAITSAAPIKAGGYTVATLPANVAGQIAYVTDQLTAPAAKGVAPTGGGAVVCYVMNTGAGWVGI